LSAPNDRAESVAKPALLHALVALLAASTAACSADLVCTASPPVAVTADVFDSVTNASAAHRSSLILDGSGIYDSVYHEASNPGDSLTLNPLRTGASGKPGTYEVRLRHAGYQLWRKRDVHVDGDRCGASPPTHLIVRFNGRHRIKPHRH
jgi:hypothetical protein